jgi:hypothetical protein
VGPWWPCKPHLVREPSAFSVFHLPADSDAGVAGFRSPARQVSPWTIVPPFANFNHRRMRAQQLKQQEGTLPLSSVRVCKQPIMDEEGSRLYGVHAAFALHVDCPKYMRQANSASCDGKGFRCLFYCACACACACAWACAWSSDDSSGFGGGKPVFVSGSKIKRGRGARGRSTFVCPKQKNNFRKLAWPRSWDSLSRENRWSPCGVWIRDLWYKG